METSIKNLITDEDNDVLHDISHLIPKVNRKWVAYNNLIPQDLKNKHFSFFRDLGILMDLFNKLGKR